MHVKFSRKFYILESKCYVRAFFFMRSCPCTLRLITTRLPGRPFQGQKGLNARALMAALRPSPPRGTAAQQAVRTPGACQATFPCRVPPPWHAPPPAGWGHGGTRNRRTSPSVQMGSVSPTAMAGVRGCPGWVEPVPLVGRGAARGTRKRACGRPKW